MATEHREKLERTRELMDDFARRTGLTGDEGNIEQRYLWTDAFAVQTFFGLAHTSGDQTSEGGKIGNSRGLEGTNHPAPDANFANPKKINACY